MLKNILIVGLLITVLSGLGSAETWIYSSTAGSTTCGGGGVGICPVACGAYCCSFDNLFMVSGSTYYIDQYVTATFDNTECSYCNGSCGAGGSGSQISTRTIYSYLNICSNTGGGSSHFSTQTVGTNSWLDPSVIYNIPWSQGRCCICSGSGTIVVTNDTSRYTISGVGECIDAITLYIYNSDSYHIMNTTSGEAYSFPIYNGTSYKIDFGGIHQYTFTVNASNINYNYDACTHTQYRFEESCGNLIPDSEGFYCENWIPTGGICKNFYAPNGILDISNTTAASFQVYTDTFIGNTGWFIEPIVDGTTYTLENPNIAWNLKVIVQNESDGTLIDGAMVKVDQSCYCTSGYSTRQKTTVNGMVKFGDMSLQDASLFVMASGYKILNENTTGYSAFLSGRTNFSSKTWVVKMAPTWSNNTSTFYESQNKVDIHFRNEGGNRTFQILDTDTEVYLYYENNNSNEEAMTLKFQSSSTHSHFIDEDSWTIAYDDIGHKTILNADFTPWTYAYRAVIYNSSIYGWNLTIPLTVRNETKEETLHYENLTTNLWFRHEADGKIDYRENMQIVSHARSNNTTLMNVDLEVWKDGVLLCYTNLTETDYENADFPYYYVYEPVYEYVPGSNYTAKMYGFDRTLLEVRYLECINDTVTRKNKLTVGVKDRAGTNLDNCYIYLEDWGSLSTGSTYYNSYEGIDNGYYRYKATKSGYTGTGWADITMSDDDEIVWYTLTEDHTNLSATQQKLTDDDIKGMFFPLMFFLLICIIFGGFKYVTN